MATVRSDIKNAHTAVHAWIVDNPGGSAPAVQYTGPAVMTEYPPVRVSPLVTIHITAIGEVTGSHDDLHGTYTIRADGAVVRSPVRASVRHRCPSRHTTTRATRRSGVTSLRRSS